MEESIPFEMKPLEEILAYENEDVIFRFMNHFNVELEETLESFDDTKKWLWLLSLSKKMATNEENTDILFINEDLLIIDEMWHTFILLTIDYREFCMDYLGMFIDHRPFRKAEKEEANQRFKENPEKFTEEMRAKTKVQYSFIYDHLGEDVLLKWHDELSKKYTIEKINSLRVNPF